MCHLLDVTESVYPITGGYSAPCVLTEHKAWTLREAKASVYFGGFQEDRRPVLQADGFQPVFASVS